MWEVGARGGGLDYWDKKIDYPVSCRAVAQAEKLVTQEPDFHCGDVSWFNFLCLKRISWWAIKIWASLLDSRFPFGLVSVFCYKERHFYTHALLITDIGRFCWMSMCTFLRGLAVRRWWGIPGTAGTVGTLFPRHIHSISLYIFPSLCPSFRVLPYRTSSAYHRAAPHSCFGPCLSAGFLSGGDKPSGSTLHGSNGTSLCVSLDVLTLPLRLSIILHLAHLLLFCSRMQK